jgi:hypothetical protein
MLPTTIADDLRAIIGAQTGAARLDEMGPTASLHRSDLDLSLVLHRLGVRPEGAVAGAQATLGDLAALLEAQDPEARTKIWGLATEARVLRLVAGSLAASRPQSPAGEALRWWQELASQVLWWFGRSAPGGLELVQRGAPARAVQSLAGLGLLDSEVLAQDKAENAATIVDVLERVGYPGDVAVSAYNALKRIAGRVSSAYEAHVQRALRRHGDRMVDEVSRDLLADLADPGLLSEAVRAWVSVTTGLPITVWSPSTGEFLAKLGSAGVTGEALARVAEELGLDLLTVDDGLAGFMEGMCRGCDPGNEEHQICVRRFAAVNWQVECPIRPDLAAQHYIR